MFEARSRRSPREESSHLVTTQDSDQPLHLWQGSESVNALFAVRRSFSALIYFSKLRNTNSMPVSPTFAYE